MVTYESAYAEWSLKKVNLANHVLVF